MNRLLNKILCHQILCHQNFHHHPTRLFIFLKSAFLLATFIINSPVSANESESLRGRKISIVYSQENANQWAGISKRLQAVGVDYCIIPLNRVQTVGDWGERRVLLMPNIENISPSQAIALEEWMSKGGRLVATGPFGVSSSPGVRQLLRTLTGGYWGFSLNDAETLQASKIKNIDWNNQPGLSAQVRGGVVIPDGLNTQVAAIWNNNDRPAVLATERTTLLGWRLGADGVANPEVDQNWLRIAIARHFKLPSNVAVNIPEGDKDCITDLASITTPIANIPRSGVNSNPRNITNNTTATNNNNFPNTQATAPRTPNISPPGRIRSDEAIDQLEGSIKLDVEPSSNRPISPEEARSLFGELNNLIGRVESANLAAAVKNNTVSANQTGSTAIASANPKGILPQVGQTLDNARQTAKLIPELIRQRQYARARSAWLQARNSLWSQFPTRSPQAIAETRAVWLDRGTIVRAGSEAGLAQIFDRLAQSGINTIFFETLNASYPIYPSQVAPQQNPLVRGWDPLASAVKLARKRGMELHAWVWVFAAGNNRHNPLVGQPLEYPGPVLAANPDWAGYDHRGQMIPQGQGKPFFDAANPQVRDYLLRLYTEIITRYDVDGLQLDYIRYPFQDARGTTSYGYGKAAREIFQQRYGVDPTQITPQQADLWRKWTDFRTEQVDSFVGMVSRQLKRKRPNLKLSVAVFPLPRNERIAKIQQNWEAWAQRGDIDLIVPMTYATETFKFETLAQPWVGSIRFDQLGSALLLPGIRLLNLSSLGTFDQLQAIRDFPVTGYALFAAENLNNDIHMLLKNTQAENPRTNQNIIPHRQPFVAAAQRYHALYQEWQISQANNQLRLPATVQSSFNEQAKLVNQALNQLGDKPNYGQISTTRATLRRFRANYSNWMRSHSLTNPYQVRIWENRLIAVEKLLRYGERVSR